MLVRLIQRSTKSQKNAQVSHITITRRVNNEFVQMGEGFLIELADGQVWRMPEDGDLFFQMTDQGGTVGRVVWPLESDEAVAARRTASGAVRVLADDDGQPAAAGARQ